MIAMTPPLIGMLVLKGAIVAYAVIELIMLKRDKARRDAARTRAEAARGSANDNRPDEQREAA